MKKTKYKTLVHLKDRDTTLMLCRVGLTPEKVCVLSRVHRGLTPIEKHFARVFLHFIGRVL